MSPAGAPGRGYHGHRALSPALPSPGCPVHLACRPFHLPPRCSSAHVPAFAGRLRRFVAARLTPAARASRAIVRAVTVALVGVASASCAREGARAVGGGDGDVGGTVVVATAAEPATLFPPLANTTQAVAVVDQLFDRLADIGDSLNTVGDRGFRPRLAQRWDWAPDSLSVTFRLTPGARWHDGRRVTARDVAFSFDVASDPAVGSSNGAFLANVDSISTPDSATATAWFKRRLPTQFFDLTYYLYVLPAHLLANVPRARLAAAPFARHPVGSGRFRFGEWTPGQRLELVADADNYRGRPRLDRVVWSVAPDFGSATIRFLGGEADFFENLRPEYLGQTTRNASLRLYPYPSLDYGFLQFNLRAAGNAAAPHPLFADRELRRALTLGVDRERLVRNAFDTLALVAAGPFPRVLFPAWRQLRPLPYNPTAARGLLDSLGWTDADGDGVRTRGGVPLAFTVLVPTSSAVRQRMAVLLQAQLRQLGARITVEPLEVGAFNARLQARRFDAAVAGWHADPSPAGALQTWGSAGTRLGGSNFGGYASPAFDAQADSALSTTDAAASQRHWLRAYQTALDDAPAVWLFEPRLVAGAHRRLRVTGLRADGWWTRLSEWYIPAGDRIGRDRVGLR